MNNEPTIDPVFTQFKVLARWLPQNSMLKEMSDNGWVVLINECNVDRIKTAGKINELLLDNLTLFKEPEFVTSFKEISYSLDLHGENTPLFASATKTAYCYWAERDMLALPLSSQLFFLKEALRLKAVSGVMKLFFALPQTKEIKDFLLSERQSLTDFMRHLVIHDEELLMELFYDRLVSFDLYHERLYSSSTMSEETYYKRYWISNPFTYTDKSLINKLKREKYKIGIEDDDGWNKVEIVICHRDEYYEISFNYMRGKVEEASHETCIDQVKKWIDEGCPKKENERFKTFFCWKPTIDQFGRMLKSRAFALFDTNFSHTSLKEAAAFPLIVRRSGVSKELLKDYFLQDKSDRFSDLELIYLFDTVGSIDREMGCRFFALGVSCRRSREFKLELLERVVKTFPNIVLSFNHDEQNDLPLAYIKERNWEFAKFMLKAGWNPLKSANGAAALEETLLSMADYLDYKAHSSSRYFEHELPHVAEVFSLLKNFISLRCDAKNYAPYQLESKCLEHEILSHVLRNGKNTDLLKFLKKGSYSFPDLVIFIAEQNPDVIIEMHHILCVYLRSGHQDLAYLRAAKRLIELGCPVEKQPTYYSEYKGKQKYTNPAKIFLKSLSNWEAGKPLNLGFSLSLLNALIVPGYDLNEKRDLKARGTAPLTYLEKFYFSQNLPRYFMYEVMVLLIEKGGEVTPRMAGRMKLELRDSPHEGLQKCLEKQGIKIEPEQAPNLPLTGAIEWLEKASRKPYLLLPLDKFGEIRRLKKTLKNSEGYEKLAAAYDKVVSNHLLLKELREISRKLRGKESIDNDERAIRLYSLWGPDAIYEFETASKRVTCLQGSSRKEFWNYLVDSIFKAGAKVGQVFQTSYVVWFHGTKISSIPPIKKDNAIIPMGKLYESGRVSFAGELIGSHRNANKDHISGHIFSPSWFHKEGQLFKASTRFSVSYLYAVKNSGYGKNEMHFDPKIAWNRLDSTLTTFDKCRSVKGVDDYAHLMADIMRLRLTSSKAEERLEPYKQTVKEWLEQSPDHEGLKELDYALNVRLAYTFEPGDLDYLERKEPVVFASLSINTVPGNYQHYAEGEQILGRDIQIAFTEEKLVDEVQDQLKERGVEVFPFEVAFYLETMQMITGSLHEKLAATPLQMRLSAALRWDILPRYALPYPEKPSYYEQGVKTIKTNPLYGFRCDNYATYRQRIDDGLIVPRAVHGKVHACRTALWTLVLYDLYKTQEIDPYFIALAGACHDIARQDEAEDKWDIESSLFFKGYIQARGFNSALAGTYAQAIAEKDNDKLESLPRKIVHDADVLEIVRCLTNLSNFKAEKLIFLRDLNIDKRHPLLQEIFAFIKFTETDGIKWHLEMESEDPFAELIQMTKDNYPHIHSHLK